MQRANEERSTYLIIDDLLNKIMMTADNKKTCSFKIYPYLLN